MYPHKINEKRKFALKRSPNEFPSQAVKWLRSGALECEGLEMIAVRAATRSIPKFMERQSRKGVKLEREEDTYTDRDTNEHTAAR